MRKPKVSEGKGPSVLRAPAMENFLRAQKQNAQVGVFADQKRG